MRTQIIVVIGLALTLGVAGAVISQAQGGSDGLGRAPESDRFARTVEATPVPPSAAAGTRAVMRRRQGPSVRQQVALMRQPADAGDELPAGMQDAPGVQLDASSARRVDAGASTPALWIATDTTDGVVMLAGADRASWFLTEDLAAGRVMRVSEQLPSDPNGVVVAGVLPDGATAVEIRTGAGAHAVTVKDGVYSERFGTAAADLPAELAFTDAAGRRHEQAIPLSPDLAP